MNTLIRSLSVIFAATAIFASPAEAQSSKRPRTPRYMRPANSVGCAAYSWKPTAKSVPGGRAANGRVPFMQTKIHKYLEALHKRGCGLVVQSTYRDCRVNSSVGGMQKSRHLCGGGADTSGCSKPIARSICSSMGLHYIEEGAGRFPHCQVEAHCNTLKHD